jgi:membrane fusion protein (multidrug efflux system)
MNSKKNLLLASALLIAVIITLASCKKENSANGGAERKIPVGIFDVFASKVEDILDTFGIIESLSTVEISAEQDGSVVEIAAKDGQCLKKGNLVLRLDDRIYKAEEARALAHFESAESTLKRQKSLFESKTISEKDYEDALSARDMAKAEHDAAKTRLDRCEIRSPIDACIDDITVELGEHLSSGKKVARFEKSDVVKLVFRIPERDVNAISVGTSVSYSFDSRPEEKFEGTISFISQAADSGSLAYRAEVLIPNPDFKLRPGMIARIRFVRCIVENAISIPVVAIIPRYGGHYVFIVKDGRAFQKEVKLAFFTGEMAVIAAGIASGDKVVVDGNRFLRERDMVEITPELR